MPSEPHWLTAQQLIAINEELVAITNEPHQLRDLGLLESAAAKPINHYHYGEQDVAALAVALLLGVARNHPFVQGNKRTALAAADAFLHLNGYRLALPDTDLANLIVDAITGAASEDVLVARLGDALSPRN